MLAAYSHLAAVIKTAACRDSMDLLLCEVIYHGEQKHLGRLKCRSGVLESLDQHDWSPVRGLMEPGQGKKGAEKEDAERRRKEDENDGEVRRDI